MWELSRGLKGTLSDTANRLAFSICVSFCANLSLYTGRGKKPASHTLARMNNVSGGAQHEEPRRCGSNERSANFTSSARRACAAFLYTPRKLSQRWQLKEFQTRIQKIFFFDSIMGGFRYWQTGAWAPLELILAPFYGPCTKDNTFLMKNLLRTYYL